MKSDILKMCAFLSHVSHASQS